MSAITYLTTLVQQAITRLNLIETNAKKVDELPHQTTLEPTSKIPVSRAGISEHVTVQQIISSIQNSNYNQLLAVGTITVDGTDIIIPSGVSGQINGLLYGTSADTILSITLCATGFSRKDIIVLTTANTVVVISGEETDGAIVLAPPTPLDAVYITEFDVNDTLIGAPIDPIIGTSFKKKSESLGYVYPSLTGSEAVIQLRPEGNSRYAFSNAGLVSIDGFGLDLISGNPDAEAPYPGKDLFIENTGTTPFSLLHLGAGDADSKFFFLDETDLVVPAGGKVWLKYGATGCEVIFKSWSEVKEVIEGYYNGTNFYTDALFTNLITPESSKIYVALDTNFTYRWNGFNFITVGTEPPTPHLRNYIYDFLVPLSNFAANTNAYVMRYNVSSSIFNPIFEVSSYNWATEIVTNTNVTAHPVISNQKAKKIILSYNNVSTSISVRIVYFEITGVNPASLNNAVIFEKTLTATTNIKQSVIEIPNEIELKAGGFLTLALFNNNTACGVGTLHIKLLTDDL